MNAQQKTSSAQQLLKRFGFTAIATAVGLSAASCTVGPEYKAPTVTVPASFAQAATRPVASTQPSLVSPTATPVVEWWSTLRDSELDSLMQRAMAGNLNLQQAESRVRESRAQLQGAGAKLTPQVSASGGYAYIDGGKGVQLGGSGNPFRTNLYTVGLDASWELDVFGGERRNIEAAAADYEGTIEAQRGVTLSLLAEVAHDYLELRGLQRRLVIAQDNLKLQQDTLELTQSLRKSGFNTQLDVSRASTEVSATKAAIVPLATAVVQTQHALATLLGEQPEMLATELETPAAVPVVPPTVSVGLPSDLLRRRPDLRRAERQLAAANARIGAAVSDYYPKFSLTGAFGLDSNQFDTMFNASSRYFLIYPSVSWKLLDFGRTKANVDVARERYKQAWLGYQNSLLTALRETEDALIAYTKEQDHRQALAEAVDSAKDSVEISREQYKQGLVDFLQVLDSQRQLLVTQDQLAQSDEAISTDLVALYKSLGGGWEVEAAKQMTAEANEEQH